MAGRHFESPRTLLVARLMTSTIARRGSVESAGKKRLLAWVCCLLVFLPGCAIDLSKVSEIQERRGSNVASAKILKIEPGTDGRVVVSTRVTNLTDKPICIPQRGNKPSIVLRLTRQKDSVLMAGDDTDGFSQSRLPFFVVEPHSKILIRQELNSRYYVRFFASRPSDPPVNHVTDWYTLSVYGTMIVCDEGLRGGKANFYARNATSILVLTSESSKAFRFPPLPE